MAVGRRVSASNQVAVRGSGARRGRRGRQPYSWLGVGALTVGVGIALAPGCGVAHADGVGAGGSSAADSRVGDSSGVTRATLGGSRGERGGGPRHLRPVAVTSSRAVAVPKPVAAVRRAAGSAQRAGNAGARAAFAAVPPGPPVAAVTGVPVGQQITVAVNTTFNALFTQLGGVPANPISGLLEGALVLVRRTVFGLVPTGVSATLNGSALEISVDPGSTAYFRQDGASL